MFKRTILLGCTVLPSFLRLAVWRLLGFKVGARCRVSILSIVIADEIEMGYGAVIGTFTFIYAPKKLHLGQRARISSFVKIVGFGEMVLEDQSGIGFSCLVDCTTGFYLGVRSILGPRGLYYTHGETGLIFNKRFPHRFAPIHIGPDCWLGMGCVVYPGVTVGEGTLVLPGVVVSRNIQPHVAAMLPANGFRTVSVDLFTMGVDEATLLRTAEKFLHKLAAFRGGKLTDDESKCSVLTLPNASRVVLVREKPPRWLKEASPRKTVIWKLCDSGEAPEIPTFHFKSLRILGPWTPLAGEVAQFLCENAGTFFAFEHPPK